MPQNQIPKAFMTPAKKRIAVGAVTLMTAGSLFGLGAAGATAAPLPASDSHSSTSASSDDTAKTDALIASLTKDLRADLADGQDNGKKAQNVATTLAGNAALFSSLPENLQADLTALKDAAPADRDALVQTIETTAADGGYGEDAKNVVAAIQKHPQKPIKAALHAVFKSDLVQGKDAAETVDKVATLLMDNPAIFDSLPQNLQDDLTALKDAKGPGQVGKALKVETTALAGGYGHEIQKIVKKLTVGMTADAKADAQVKSDN